MFSGRLLLFLIIVRYIINKMVLSFNCSIYFQSFVQSWAQVWARTWIFLFTCDFIYFLFNKSMHLISCTKVLTKTSSASSIDLFADQTMGILIYVVLVLLFF